MLKNPTIFEKKTTGKALRFKNKFLGNTLALSFQWVFFNVFLCAEIVIFNISNTGIIQTYDEFSNL